MENKKLMAIAEALWNTHLQGEKGDTELLQCAVLSLCAEGKISRDEAVDVGWLWKQNCKEAGRNMPSLRSRRNWQMKLCCG